MDTAKRVEIVAECLPDVFTESKSMLRDYAAILRELESAKAESNPVAWRYRLDGDMQWQHTSDKRICMGEIEPLYAVAPIMASARVGETLRFFASGPQGYFYCCNAQDAEELIIRAHFDREDWTITDLFEPAKE